ncbi:MAG TPA: 4Fe-4S binding protein [Cyclobacteriaceae bacterium]|nr:4Fe-4S binding protein [Cyclobacteriaceae bacterium]
MDDIAEKPAILSGGRRKGIHNSYWGNIGETVSTLWKGLMLTLMHFTRARKRWYPLGVNDKEYYLNNSGAFTVRYPHEILPVPDNGRYKLHNEIEDCIVCDKCANICPVDCIEIESIRAVREFGKTSDGTPRKIYAARFDIDMAKCCFCGLCTTVCPTECLTMTKEFDFSEYEIKNHIFSFARMSPEEIALKRKEWEEFEKNQPAQSPQPGIAQVAVKPKPVIRTPSSPVNPVEQAPDSQTSNQGTGSPAPAKFKPKIKIPGSSTGNEKTGDKKDPGNPGPDKTDDKN